MKALLVEIEQGGIKASMHKRYDKDFNAKVFLEALRSEKMIQEIAAAHSVHLNLVGQWKKQLSDSVGTHFEKEGKDKEAEAAERKQDPLFKQIGQLRVENDIIKKVQTTVRDRAEAVEPDHPDLSIARQCEILDELRAHLFYGYRKVARALAFLGVTRKRARRIMNRSGFAGVLIMCVPPLRAGLPDQHSTSSQTPQEVRCRSGRVTAGY